MFASAAGDARRLPPPTLLRNPHVACEASRRRERSAPLDTPGLAHDDRAFSA